MIISNDVKPDRDLYYLGSKVIEILLTYKGTDIDFFDLFEKVNKELEISMSLFTFTLDWLFIIGIIKNSNKGLLKKCF